MGHLSQSKTSELLQDEVIRAKWREGIHYCYDLVRDVYDYVIVGCESLLGVTGRDIQSLGIESLVRRIHPEDIEWIHDEVESGLPEERSADSLVYRLRDRDGRFIRVFELRHLLGDERLCPSKMVGFICICDS